MKHKKHKKKKKKNQTLVIIVSILVILAISSYVLDKELLGKATAVLPKERMMEADYIIGKDDRVSIVNVRAYEGPLRNKPTEQTDYRVDVYGRNSQLFNQLYFPAYFVVFDPFQEVDEIPVTIALPYREQYAIVDIVHNNSIIFRHDVTALCQQDGICQGRENTISCPADCPTGGKDNYCDRKPDNICDPDCLAGDEDCNSGGRVRIFTTIGIAVILAVVALFLKKRGNRI